MRERASVWVLVAAAWITTACDDGAGEPPAPPGEEGVAVETNVAPALCESDDDCGSGGPCNIEPGQSSGYCSVSEHVASKLGTSAPGGGESTGTGTSAAPAPCDSDDDCGSGGPCRIEPGQSTGFCATPEMIVNDGGAGACPVEPPHDPCAAVRCRRGTHCEAGSCVRDEPSVSCGGFAGFPCPGEGTCIDDPSDDCSPRSGGADCGGICTCLALGLCIEGYRWDSSPEICGCVPDEPPPEGECLSQGLCVPGYHWNSAPEVCACVPDACLNQGFCVEGYHWDSSPDVCGCVPDEGSGCGSNTCRADQYCCNASCGICAPRGGACIQVACGAGE